MATPSSKPPANGFVAVMRRVYNPIGFTKGYNFVLWFILSGAMMGFVLARFIYLDYTGIFCDPTKDGAAPGECWAYSTAMYREIGIKTHLYTVIPAGFLACLQFVPIIRHKALLFHRINGYLVTLLALAATASAMMIANVSFGGGIDVQAALGLLAILFVGSLVMAIYNVKRLQLEQHRAWMLRAWVYSGAIITTRLIMIIAAMIISTMGTFYAPMKCDKLGSFYDTVEELREAHPGCTSENAYVAVQGNMDGPGAEYAGSALYQCFGIGLWLSIALHGIGVETYLRLTPAEFERLRNISYIRQVEAGFKKPGSAGLTVDRLGDSEPWAPVLQVESHGSEAVELMIQKGQKSSDQQLMHEDSPPSFPYNGSQGR